MAPNNKPKKPTMLQRQRQLRAQQQQVKRASANKLPPGKKGGDVAKPTPKPPAGVPKALPPGNRGGALATRPSASPAKPQPKPPAQRGGAIEKAGPTIDVKANTPKVGAGKPPVRTGQPGPSRPALPASVRGAASAATRGGVGMGGLAGGVLYAAGSNLIDRYGQALNRAIRTERAVRMSSDGGRYVPGDQQRPTPAQAPKPAAKPKPPTRSSGGNPPAPGSSRRQPSSGGGSSAPSRPASTSPSRSSSPQTSSGTAGKGQQWADFNPNRGTSKSNNPLLDREGGYLRERMKAREDAANKKFDTNSDIYTPNTKVDGSGLDTKKLKKRRFGTDS